VAEAFNRFAQAEPARFIRIDSSGARDETHRTILQAVVPLLGEAG
jgi:dTMP kinase